MSDTTKNARYWRERAVERFGTTVPISAHGRWALCTLDDAGVVKSVYLLETEAQARAAALGVNRPSIEDLAPKYVPDIKDDYEDRQWLKRQA